MHCGMAWLVQSLNHVTQNLTEELPIVAVNVESGVLSKDLLAARTEGDQLGLHLLPHRLPFSPAGRAGCDHRERKTA